MKKTDFLLSSFTKALNKPKTTLFKDYILCCRNSESGYIFTDRDGCDFSPFLLKNHTLKELSDKFKHDIKHNKQLSSEIDTFNHYFSENIIIPDDFPKANNLRIELGLHSLSRQSAQIKCLLATIIPSDFQQKFDKIAQDYQNLIKKNKQCFNENPKADELIKIMDFSFYYKKITNKFHILDLFYTQNKSILKKRLTEIIETLIDKRSISTDFTDNGIFRTPLKIFGKQGKIYHAFYNDALLYLSGKLLTMRNNPEALKLALLLVQNNKNFPDELRYFRNSCLSPNFHDLIKIKRSAQNLYEKFALICYLNAIRASLEIFYATDNPLPKNQPLPSVAPQEEMKKIKEICERSQKISIKKGHLAKLYSKALADFQSAQTDLMQAIDDYRGPDFNF